MSSDKYTEINDAPKSTVSVISRKIKSLLLQAQLPLVTAVLLKIIL